MFCADSRFQMPYVRKVCAHVHTRFVESSRIMSALACSLHAWRMYTTYIVSKANSYVAYILQLLLVFSTSCALKIIFGISSRHEMLFRFGACELCAVMICLLRSYPILTLWRLAAHVMPTCMSGRSYAVMIIQQDSITHMSSNYLNMCCST